MRIISQDRKTDAEYNGNTFYVIDDDGKFTIGTRSIDYRLYAPLGTYDTEDRAIDVLLSLSTMKDEIDVFYMPEDTND